MLNKKLIENGIDYIFDIAQKKLLEKEYISSFFSSVEKFQEHLEKQKKFLISTSELEQKDLIVKYENLGIRHYEKGIPYFDILAFFEHIKNAIFSIHKKDNNFYIFKILTIFDNIKNWIAHGYLKGALINFVCPFTELEKFKIYYKELIECFENLKSSIIKTSLYKERMKTENCPLSAKLNSIELQIVYSDFEKYKYIISMHELIHKLAMDIVYLSLKNKYYDAYLSFKFMEILSYKFAQELANQYFNFQQSKEEKFLYFFISRIQKEKDLYLVVINVTEMKIIKEIYGKEIADKLLDIIEKIVIDRSKMIDKNSFVLRGWSGEIWIGLKSTTNKNLVELMKYLKKDLKVIKFEDVEIRPKVSIVTLELKEIPQLQRNLSELKHIILYAIETTTQKEIPIYIEKKQIETQIIPQIRKRSKNIEIIKTALDKNKIDIFFHPIVKLRSKKTEYVELLARVIENGNIVPIGNFIDFIYEFNLFSKLDTIVLNKAINYIETLHHVVRGIFVNIAPLSLKSKEIVKAMVNLNLYSTRIGLKVIFELTEQSFYENIDIIKFLHKQHKFSFAIDDFGTGYSSFSTIAELCEANVIKFLKLDGSLVKEINKSQKMLGVVSSINSMSKDLGLTSIAEFVESKDLLDTLKKLNFDYGQGFYFFKPMPLDSLLQQRFIS